MASVLSDFRCRPWDGDNPSSSGIHGTDHFQPTNPILETRTNRFGELEVKRLFVGGPLNLQRIFIPIQSDMYVLLWDDAPTTGVWNGDREDNMFQWLWMIADRKFVLRRRNRWTFLNGVEGNSEWFNPENGKYQEEHILFCDFRKLAEIHYDYE